MKKILIALSAVILSACAGGIDHIDTSNKNQDCVRQCTASYSQCMGGSIAMAAQSGCGSGFKACSNTCPAK